MKKIQSLLALSKVFVAIYHIGLKDGECTLIKAAKADEAYTPEVNNIAELKKVLCAYLKLSSDAKRLDDFLNLDTAAERLGEQDYIMDEYQLKGIGWGRFSLLPCLEDDSDEVSDVLLCIRTIDVIKKAAIKAERDMERKNTMLKETLAAAHHANQAKTTFLNSMSHDIRTPMNAIIGFTALALSHIDNKGAVQDYLKKITVSSNHLLSLINDVLDMSRIESGRTKLEEAEVSLPNVLHDLRSIIHSAVEAKQLDLFVDIQDVVHETVMVDKLRLNQVLLNILGNAIKFTPSGGMVSLRMIENPCSHKDYAEYEIHIKDTGIGMSKEYMQHIFEPFTREETSTVSGIQGSGLGMAITKNIVDMMNGAIAVSSEEGKGTEFTVILNLKTVGHGVSQLKVPELMGMHALVADDDFNTCSSVSKMLTTMGMRPEWTTSGKEAVLRTKYAKDAGDSFHVFIIDWLMPDMNGIEVVRRIRKEIGDTIPIIILTAYDWTDVEDEALEAGVTGFCAKPLFLSELRDVLSRPFRHEEKEDVETIDVDFTGKRILMAEDNELNRELAVAILTEFGFEIETVADGLEAVNKVCEHEAGYYDVLFTDIQMPVMDGYTTSRTIRELDDPAKANMPIFAITANAFEEDKRLALAAKMNGHLVKPFNIDDIIHALSQVLK